MKSSLLPFLLASSFIFLISRCPISSSAVIGISGKSKVTYEIPTSLSAGDELITDFKAVSSHGRAAEADATPAIRYTSYQVASRAIYLFLMFAPMFFTSGLAYISSWYRNGIWFSLVRYGISQGGAAFIKWAQWASTRPDIFPEQLCSVLSTLQSGAPEHTFAFTNQQIKEELGAPIDSIFEFFSARPIASGSIAQVYKARLNGVDVAVKVRHPNVEEQIGIDFIIMKAIARIIDNTPGLEWLKLSETMSQFSATIASQTDLGVEGRHLYLFNHYFRNWKGVSFPKPIILTQSILVESFELGDSVDKYSRTISCRGNFEAPIKKIANQSSQLKNEKKKIDDIKDLQDKLKQCDLAHFIVTTGQDTYLKMLLQDNLMHADLHPGNILIQQSYPTKKKIDKNVMNKEMKVRIGESPIEIEKEALLVAKMPSHSNPSHIFINSKDLNDNRNQNLDSISTKIVLVDAGMVARLVPDEQMNFIGLLEAMGEGRGDEAAEHVMRFSNNQNYDDNTKINFRRDMKELFDQDCRGYGFDVNIGVALRGVLNLVRIHKITIDANYATLVMNCLCLDSMAHNLLPSYNILDGAKPLLRFNKFLKKVPGSFFILKAAIPIAQWLKRKRDRLFLSRIRRRLQEISASE